MFGIHKGDKYQNHIHYSLPLSSIKKKMQKDRDKVITQNKFHFIKVDKDKYTEKLERKKNMKIISFLKDGMKHSFNLGVCFSLFLENFILLVQARSNQLILILQLLHSLRHQGSEYKTRVFSIHN